MKLSIKRITPFVVAGGLILTSCNRTDAAINENNIDNDTRPSIEYSVDDYNYSRKKFILIILKAIFMKLVKIEN